MRGHSRNMETYTGSWNWEDKSQITVITGSDIEAVREYHRQAEIRLGTYEDVLKDIAGNFGFKVNILPPCVKKEESALRKVWDRNAKAAYGQPENIIDYLRASIIVPDGANGIQNLRRTIETLVNHPLTIAYKDQFWKPEDGTGYRSFKALLNIGGHTAELKVDYEGMKDANDLTEYMRSFERTLKSSEERAPLVCTDRSDIFGNSLRKMTTKMEGMIGMIRDLRRECHDYYAAKCGLNELLDPARKTEHSLATNFAESVHNTIKSGNPFARGLKSMLGKMESRPTARLH